ncbi:MAG TPA: tRNA (N6-threonylcarbamoyladenosine(37)-N6)-methyltransferase TrmO [Dehalococcoidia bacterium]
MAIEIAPIGYVRSKIKELHSKDWESVTSDIVVNEGFTEALDGLEAFSHIIVAYWMHRTLPSERSIMKVHPRRDPKLPLIGVFATRSPARPNPIGIATVKLLERRDNILKVIGLDAINGTPVLDIKPHIPGSDSPAAAKVPEWLSK